jgi:DNA-binding MltR family transcriptional regulator
MAYLQKEFDDLVKAIVRQQRGSHAGIVMASASIFEAQLESALTRAMHPLSKELQKRVFDSFGPLSTFSSKIVMAHALGIVPAAIYRRLEQLRKLRNAFAHSPDVLHFGSSNIVPLLQALLGSTTIPPSPESAFIDAIKPIEVALKEYAARQTPST